MTFTQKIKKFVAITLAGAIFFLTTNSLPVHAADISQVSAYKPGCGLVSTDSGAGVNVRNAPNLTTSEIIRSIPNDTFVMIVGESGDFYKVQYDTNGHYGYMIKDLVYFFHGDNYLQADTTNGGPLNMYMTWEESSPVLIQIPNKVYFGCYMGGNSWYVGVYGTVLGCTLSKDTKIFTY